MNRSFSLSAGKALMRVEIPESLYNIKMMRVQSFKFRDSGKKGV